MSFEPPSRRLAEFLVRRFSEPELRRAAERQFPGWAADLPSRPASLRTLAHALVEQAQRHGCLLDLALGLLGTWSRRTSSIGAMVLCVVTIASAALATRQVMRGSADDTPGDARPASMQAPPPDSAPMTEPAPAPEASPVLDPPVAVRSAEAPRKRRAARAPSDLSPEALPPAPEDPQTDLVREPTTGNARCSGGVCILSANSGLFLKSEEFCVEQADGSGVHRCIIHSRLVHPDATVTCDLSTPGKESWVGDVRWRVCSG